MEDCLVYGVPFLVLFFLIFFAGILWYWQAHSLNNPDRGKTTKYQSARVYKDFEMYLKVVLGLTTAFGYIRLTRYESKPELARQALKGIGSVSLFVMWIFCIFVICHQGSKLRRWRTIEWPKMIFWQELWACVAMWLFSSGIWVAAWRW